MTQASKELMNDNSSSRDYPDMNSYCSDIARNFLKTEACGQLINAGINLMSQNCTAQSSSNTQSSSSNSTSEAPPDFPLE